MSSAYNFTPTDSASDVSEFLAACRSLKGVARHHLANGWFEPWLRDAGRDDLASRAAKLRGEEDGLERFLKSARPTQRARTAA